MTEEEKIDLLAANIVVLLPREISLNMEYVEKMLKESIFGETLENRTWQESTINFEENYIISYDNYNISHNRTSITNETCI